jgi:cell division protein FtsI (penicillin-binding protein 3)
VIRERPPIVPPLVAGETRSRREKQTRLRLMLLALTISLWALVVGIRLVHLQVLARDFFVQQGTRQSERTLNLDPRRGPILDREGRPLAVSVDAESVYAVPQDVGDAEEAAAALARALPLDAAGRREVLAQLQKNRAFVWIRRKVDPATARRVRDLELDGIGFVAEHRRYYPQRELAAHVLGYVGLDNTGMYGVEYALEKEIRGRAAKVVVHTDARRRPVAQTERPSTDGDAVVLTIDQAIQHIAERELDRSMAETQADSGMVIVVEPFTGEVLAMAGRPTFNPNRYLAYPVARWRNRAVSDVFEPGSIFKIVTAAAGLQEKVVEPDEVLDCGHGRIEVAGITINDHAIFDRLTFTQAVEKSSDVGMIRVGQRLGRENFARYVHAFGFGEPTGIELPGESGGLFRPISRWSARSLPSLAFGQEIGVTGLQITMAAAAIANGGYLMKPILVKRVEDDEGRVVRETKPRVVRRVLDPDTVDTLARILRGVVIEGTGRRAAVPGYAVAGKTGTAQKIDASGRYSPTDNVASFVGFLPASRPAIVILASLDTPRGPADQGGDVAAPLFARVAEAALRVLAVPPDDPSRVLRAVVASPPEAYVPAAYRPQAPARPAVAPPVEEGGLMPDLRGRSAREAAIAAARRGLVVELHGSGQVVAQEPDPGTEIEPGATCVLTLGHGGEP